MVGWTSASGRMDQVAFLFRDKHQSFLQVGAIAFGGNGYTK